MTPEDKRIIWSLEFSQAYNKHDGKWPDHLTSGVMFWNGEKIKLEHFIKYKMFLKTGSYS